MWTIDARAGRSPAELAADLANADALVVRSATKVDAALIAAAPKLRAIARAGTGVDNVDVAAASARGIVVMNAPGATASASRSTPWALILALARNIPAADRAMKQGDGRRSSSSATRFAARRSASSGWAASVRKWRIGARAFGMRSGRARSVHLDGNRGRPRRPSCCRSTICARRPTTCRSTCRRPPRRDISSTTNGSPAARRGCTSSIRRAAT